MEGTQETDSDSSEYGLSCCHKENIGICNSCHVI